MYTYLLTVYTFQSNKNNMFSLILKKNEVNYNNQSLTIVTQFIIF